MTELIRSMSEDVSRQKRRRRREMNGHKKAAQTVEEIQATGEGDSEKGTKD